METETVIGSLCQVESVFDGVDIEVTVEFSAGGGTFEHDELTAASRALPDQHPIGAISDLTEILESLRDAIRASAGAAITLVANPTPQTITITETPITYSELFPSTDTEVIDFESNNLIAKRAGRYFFASNIRINKTVGVARTITIYVRNKETGAIITPYPRIIELGTGIGLLTVPTQTIPIDVAGNTVLEISAMASGTGCSFALLETNFYTATGGGSGLWKQNAKAELIIPTDIDVQDKELLNSKDVAINGLATEATYTPTVWAYIVGLFTTVPKSVLQHIVKIWSAVQNIAARVGILEDNYILKYVVPVDSAGFDLTTDRHGNAFNFVEGDEVEIIIQVKLYSAANRINLRFNGNYENIYNEGSSVGINYLYTAGAVYTFQYTSFKFKIIGTEVQGVFFTDFKTAADVRSFQYYTFHTEGGNFTSINTLNFFRNTTASSIPTGSIIIIKKR